MTPPAIPTLGADQISGYMRETVALSLAEVERGGIPFSGLVVHPRTGILGTGVNQVVADADPTAHAEVVALRRALDAAPGGIQDCVLFASGEPCGMCYGAALQIGIDTIFYAVDRDQAARYGFDYRASYCQLARDPRTRADLSVRAWPITEGLGPFTAWSDRQSQQPIPSEQRRQRR